MDEICAVRSCLLHADRYPCDRPVLVRIFTWSYPEANYKSTKADARNGIEFRGTTQCDPHWFMLHGAETQSSEDEDGKSDFCQYWYEKC